MVRTFITVIMQVIAGSLSFFIFKQQTTAFYFQVSIVLIFWLFITVFCRILVWFLV